MYVDYSILYSFVKRFSHTFDDISMRSSNTPNPLRCMRFGNTSSISYIYIHKDFWFIVVLGICVVRAVYMYIIELLKNMYEKYEVALRVLLLIARVLTPNVIDIYREHASTSYI